MISKRSQKKKWSRVWLGGITSVGLVGVMTGCGTKDPIEAIRGPIVSPELMNTWAGDCKDSDLLNLSTREFYQLSGDSLLHAQEFYTGEDCTNPAVMVKYTGNFALQDDVAEVPGAKQIDLQFSQVRVTPLNQAGKDALDAVDFCGQEEWVVSMEVDLTSLSARTLCPLTDTPYALFDDLSDQHGKAEFWKGRGGSRQKWSRQASSRH